MDNTENSGKRVAIQGYSGCFHEQAARIFYGKYDGSTPVSVECPTFDDLYRSLDTGRADAAIMAIENTVSGGLLPNFELLRKYNVKIKGEVFLRIQQNLMALPGQKIEDIKEVRTHYMAINQTRPFFQSYPWIRLVESEDTAKSAADVAEQKLQGVGAVASLLAADLYGLEVLKESIETYKQNFTRFLILDDGITVGSLAQILTIMSFYDMNLTRIQSLPIPGKSWQYFFYADIKFDNYLRYSQAISAVRPLMEDLNILGEYEAAL